MPNNIEVHETYPWKLVGLQKPFVDWHANGYFIIHVLKYLIIYISIIHMKQFS